MAYRALDADRAAAVEALCELIVPGSASAGPAVYVDALIANMPPPVQDAAYAAIDALAPAAAEGAKALAEHESSPEFGFVRALVIEAYYSDFVAPGSPGRAPGPRSTSTHRSRRGSRKTGRTWGSPMKDAFDVVVVGSGAGGGVVAGELAERGRDVLLLETGPHLTAADFTRWEAKATHDMWWPLRLAPAGEAGLVAFLAGRCVGGTTTINTKVALRAHDKDVAKWQPATGLTKEDGAAFTRRRPRSVLRPGRGAARRARAHRLAEERLHVRAGLPRARRRARAGALVHGPELHVVRLVPPGLPDERRQVDDEHVHPRRVGCRAARAARERRTSSAS